MSDQLAQLAELADKQMKAEAAVEQAEVELRIKQKALRDINERLIPELMDEIGIEEFTTTSGLKITVKEAIRASITKERRAEAMKWLREHGYSKLIKHTFTLAPQSPDQAEAMREKLEAFGLEYGDSPTVHPSTLGAWVRKRLEEGEDIPLELFGVYRQRVSKVEI